MDEHSGKAKILHANIINEILSVSETQYWHHIPGKWDTVDHSTRSFPLQDVERTYLVGNTGNSTLTNLKQNYRTTQLLNRFSEV